MEGCLCDVVSRLPHLEPQEVLQVLRSESKDREVTISLLNLLHNIVITGAVPVSKGQTDFFDKNVATVLHLLGSKKSLKWKKKTLEDNISIVLNIAASCPSPVDG